MAKKIIAALTDSTVFLQEWFVNPQRTGSVAPSSPQLGAAMAHWLPRNPESFVLELGPGTGAVTDALIKCGLREDRLVAIEHNPKMARLLREKFPRAQIITGDAWQMDTLLRSRREPVESRRRGHFQPAAAEFSARRGRGARRKNPRRAGTATATGCNTAITSSKTRSAARPAFNCSPPRLSG